MRINDFSSRACPFLHLPDVESCTLVTNSYNPAMPRDGRMGRRIRKLRTAAGLTQHELAAPDYTHAYVSQIESGRRDPSPAALQHFARQLGVGVEELQTGRPPDLDERLGLELQDARRMAAAGKIDEADDLYAAAHKQASRYSLPRQVATALQGRALCAELKGDLDRAIELYEEAEKTLENEPVTSRVDAIAGRARCLQTRGDTRTSVYLLEQAMETLERQQLNDPGSLLRLHTSLVAAYFERGAYERAAASAEAALALAQRTQDPERVAGMHVNVARVLLDQGRIADAHDSLRRAEELFRELDLRSNVADCHHSRGFMLSRQGELDEAEAELMRALEVFQTIDTPLREARSTIELARLKRLRGEGKAAEELLQRALDLAGKKGSIEIAEAQRELALCRQDDDPKSAEKLLQDAATFFKKSQERAEFAATLRLLGDLRSANGDLEGAAKAFREGIVAVEERL